MLNSEIIPIIKDLPNEKIIEIWNAYSEEQAKNPCPIYPLNGHATNFQVIVDDNDLDQQDIEYAKLNGELRPFDNYVYLDLNNMLFYSFNMLFDDSYSPIDIVVLADWLRTNNFNGFESYFDYEYESENQH